MIAAMAALFLISPYGAYAAQYIQASSNETQLPSDTNAHRISINSTDASAGISQKEGVFIIPSDGAYLMIAEVQVGRKGAAAGEVNVWLRVNGKDVANTNSQQNISNSDTTVVMTQCVMMLKKGDQYEVMQRVSALGLGVIAIKHEEQPVVPSISVSLMKLN
jgi:CRISPR/Cas system-associated protein Csx1